MPDYSLGKIYKIVGNGKVYIGSTTRPLLSQRLAKHKSAYKAWKNGDYKQSMSSFECLDDPECYIELLEACPCNCFDELRKCEGKWIRELDCVNRRKEDGTRSEHNKKYREANKEKMNERQKKYREADREKYNKYMKEYRLKQKNIIFSNIGDGEVAAILD